MKRVLIRTALAMAVVVPGVIAAAYAQRAWRSSGTGEAQSNVAGMESDAQPTGSKTTSSDPFSGSRFVASSESNPRGESGANAGSGRYASAADEPGWDGSGATSGVSRKATGRVDRNVLPAAYAAEEEEQDTAPATNSRNRYARRNANSPAPVPAEHPEGDSTEEIEPADLDADPDARLADGAAGPPLESIDNARSDQAYNADDLGEDEYGDEVPANDQSLDDGPIDNAADSTTSRDDQPGASPPRAAPTNPFDDPSSDSARAETAGDDDSLYADDPVASDSATSRSTAATGLEGMGRPGTDEQEGPQAPLLTIEKFAPEEIQIGKPATFEIAVTNTGNIPAHDVEVLDTVPQGTTLVATDPPAQADAAGNLAWSVGTLKPGEERILLVDVLPNAEGELGSVARVRFSAHATARTLSTRPKLDIEVQSDAQVLIGEPLVLSIHVSNPGTGIATGVIIEAALPEGLEHEAGAELEYEVGDLKPNESRDLDLQLMATKAGVMVGEIAVRGDGNLRAEQPTDIEVLAPGLVLGLKGSKRRYLEREATYVISVSNPGTAPARDVELASYLPEGFQFVKADNYGEYDAETRTVHWSLEELPPGETGEVSMTAMPTAAGEQKLLVEGSAASGLSQKQEHMIQVDGVSAIMFTVVDVADPIEVKGETTYEVRVVNQGSKAAAGVRLVVALPEGLTPLDAEGPTRHAIEGSQVVFDSLEQLAPKADATYLVKVQAAAAGDQRVKVQLLTDEMRTPVTKEESTRVLEGE
jgi:uncharacterized repeat protein (TIGR01451 family)